MRTLSEDLSPGGRPLKTKDSVVVSSLAARGTGETGETGGDGGRALEYSSAV